MALNSEQKKYLNDRLARLRNTKHVFFGSSPVRLKKGPEVLSAEKSIERLQRVITRYEKACRKATEQRDERRRIMFDLCSREIANGDYKKALAAVDKLDHTEF